MPLKYDSMPKITFCFTKDYLEEIRKVMFALQVPPVFWDTGLHFMPDVLFSNIRAQDTVKQIKKIFFLQWSLEMLPLKKPTFIN